MSPDILNVKKPMISTTRPMQEQYRNRIVEVVLLVVAIILFANFLLMPKRSAVAEQKQQLEELTLENENIAKNKQQLNTLVQQMKTSKKDLALLDSTLPLNSRVTTTHVLLDSLVAASGLTLATISTDTSDDMVAAGDSQMIKDPFGGKHTLKTVQINLGVTGTMDQFLSFLKSLENSARIVDVKNITINQGTGGSASFGLTLKTYFYGLDGAPEAAASAPAAEASE